MKHSGICLLCVVLVAGCGEKVRDLDGIWPTQPGNGPMVVFNPLSKPSPIVPFPNDLMTIADTTTFTGKRLNIPVQADTRMETNVRMKLNTLDGFGTFAPITVSFDKPLAPSTVTDTTVMVVNLNPSSPMYGQKARLSLGSGAFPQNISPHSYVDPADPFRGSDNLLFSSQVTLTTQNFEKFYDEESNTVILRPLLPLDQSSLHAVILTRGLKGADGEPVRSPFKYVNHSFQTAELRKALPILAGMGITPPDIAFAWVFTTQSVTALLEAVQLGFQGKGALSRLKESFPPVVNRIYDLGPTCENGGNTLILPPKALQGLVSGILTSPIGELLAGSGSGTMGLINQAFHFSNVDHFVFGNFNSPSLIATPDEVMDLNPMTGEGTIGVGTVPFFAAVPKPTKENGYAQPPYPVVIFGHGYGGLADLDMLALSNIMGGFGIAVMSIDAVGFGPTDYLSPLANPEAAYESFKEVLPPEFSNIPVKQVCDVLRQLLVEPIAKSMCVPYNSAVTGCDFFRDLTSHGLFYVLTRVGRAEDVNGDGLPDSGATFVTSNIFRTRDVIRQTVIDEMMLSRIIKSMGTYPQDVLKGVFLKDDGTPLIGGPGLPVFYAGQSMGGVMGSILMAVDPNIVKGILNVPGGGMGDLMLRSTLVRSFAIFTEVFGPVVVGMPSKSAGMADVFINDGKAPFGRLPAAAGDMVVVQNISSVKTAVGAVRTDKTFSVHIPADEGDVVAVWVEGRAGFAFTAVTKLQHGMGLYRNTPDFRRQVETSQIGTDSADPLNYAIHYNNYDGDGYPRYTLYGGQGPMKNIFMQVFAGDNTVPVSTGIMLGRAAGLIDQGSHDNMIQAGLPAHMIGHGSSAQEFSSFGQYFSTSGANLRTIYQNPALPGSIFEFHLTNAHEYYLIPEGTEDVGAGDGVSSFNEPGFYWTDTTTLDPNGDDYCPEIGKVTETTYTEGNGLLNAGEDNLSTSDSIWRNDGILETDYTTLAQRESALLFKYGIIMPRRLGLGPDCYHLLDPMPVCVEAVNQRIRSLSPPFSCP